MLGSTALGGIMKMWGQAQADKAEQHKMLLQGNLQIEDSINNARRMQDPNSAWIRRFIVVFSLLAGIGIVFLAPIMGISTNVPIEITFSSLQIQSRSQ